VAQPDMHLLSWLSLLIHPLCMRASSLFSASLARPSASLSASALLLAAARARACEHVCTRCWPSEGHSWAACPAAVYLVHRTVYP
jgi:hypothetical protein